MSVERRASWRRWSLVAVAAAVLVTAPLVVAALPARVDPVEPGRLRSLIAGPTQPHQGYAESVGSLGVPDLPNLGDVTSLLNGTTRVRVWYDSPRRWRFDVLTAGGERDVYRTADGEYVWDYGANLLTRFVGEPPLRLPRAGDLLPPELARRVLQAAPDDPVEALAPRRVAGLSAAGLRVRPADPQTSVAHVDIWADPATGLPLQVELTARGAARPVLVSRFLEVTIGTPPQDVLTPDRPPGSGLAMVAAPDVAAAIGTFGRARMPSRLAGRDAQPLSLAGLPGLGFPGPAGPGRSGAGPYGVGVYGTGLSAFVALPLPRDAGGSALDAARKAGATTVELPGGSGQLLTIPPLTLLVVRSVGARRTYLLAGLVDPELLRQAAAELSVLPRSDR